MPGYREILIEHGTTVIGSAAARAVRTSRPPKPDVAAQNEAEAPDRPALRGAEELLRKHGHGGGGVLDPEAPEIDPSGPLFCPDGIFDRVEDREEAKVTMRAALSAPRPVHVLLEGDPASGKSDLLRCCLDSIPRARYAVGGMVTPSGMVEYLLEQPGTSIVLIDELDKVREPGDYAALYELMESGQVPRMMHGKTEVLRWRGRVFAAANSTEKIPSALLSRFRIIRLKPYTREQLLHINRVVAEREGVSAKRAAEIAQLAAGRSQDPRDARDLARMAGEEGELGPLLQGS